MAATSQPVPLRQNRDFLLLWSGQVISNLGEQTMLVVVPLLVLALTGSPAQAGFIGALGAIPNLILGLPVGALIDRWNRKAIMVVADTVRFLAVGSVPLAYLFHRLSLTQLYIVELIAGIAAIFFDNAETASLPRIVPPTQLARSVTFNEVGGWLAAVIGPGLGGIIIGLARSTLVGAILAYFVNAISFLASVVSLSNIRCRFQTERDPAPWRLLLHEIAEGLHFLWRHRKIRNLTMFAAIQMLLGAPATLAVIVLARNDLQNGARTIGLIFSALSAAGVAGAVLAPWLVNRLAAGRIIIGAVIIQALAAPILAAAFSAWMLIVGGAIIVFVEPASASVQRAYRLEVTPDALQGRVNSAYWLLVSGTAPLTMAATGLLLSAVGPRVVLVIVAIAVAAAAVLAGTTGIAQITIVRRGTAD